MKQITYNLCKYLHVFGQYKGKKQEDSLEAKGGPDRSMEGYLNIIRKHNMRTFMTQLVD